MNDVLANLHWQAGLFEGEGSIRIERPHPRQMGSLTVDVVNTDETIVRIFEEMWGGAIRAHASVGNRKAFWRWRCSSSVARSFLEAMYPLLRTDKYTRRAVLALDFCAQKQGSNYVRDPAKRTVYLAAQWGFYWRMRELNRRGTRPL